MQCGQGEDINSVVHCLGSGPSCEPQLKVKVLVTQSCPTLCDPMDYM